MIEPTRNKNTPSQGAILRDDVRDGSAPRHFVFLQGGFSSFLNRIGTELDSLGHRVSGVNFCFGDQLLWRGKATINYRGKLAHWPDFIGALFDRDRVTDLVLLGEQRNYHREAVAAALQRGIRVSVTDFGYLRPDWITFERNGMSGNSLFPRDPATIRQLAAGLPQADLSPSYTDSTWNMSVGDLVYSFSNVLFWWLYPHYRRSDKRAHPIRFFPSLGLRLLFSRFRNRQAEAAFADIRQRATPYFLFPLQLDHDFQITAYSPFDSMDDAIRQVFKSFATNAPAGTELLLKVHPWDPNFKNWPRLTADWAREFGIAERVTCIDGGDLDDMLRQSRGSIMVNSTTGIRALQLGCPVRTLGDAIYDIAGLTHQGELDDFWSAPPTPDAGLVDAFINAIAGTIQIRGVYYKEPGLSAAVTQAVELLHTDRVGPPLNRIDPSN